MTTICDKINTVGNVLQENLNDRGVACEYGVGTGKSTITDMVNMVTSTNFKGADDVLLSIFANRPYLTTGETTDVIVRLEDGLGKPLTNKNIKIGKSVFKDNGTTVSYNEHWYINSYGTATVQSDGTKLLNTSGDINFVMRHIIPSNKTISDANAYSYNPPYIVEFDIVETDATTSNSDAQVQIYSQQTTNNFAQNLTTGHYKIEITSEEQKMWVDDTLIKTTNLSLPNARITLRVRNSKYLIYKNFKVYEIINGVTDEKGEFALYNQTVTDDTIYTATYSNITVSCDVPFCQFVDYGVTNNSDVTKWYKNNGSSSVDDNGTKMQAPSTTQYLTVAISNEQHNNYAYAYTLPFTVEFDLVDFGYMGTTTDTRFQIYSVSTNTNTSWDLRNYGVGHYKFVAIDGSQKLFFNGVEQSKKFTQSATNLTNSRVGFQTYNFVKFKNFAIY